jgi:hypothetical protein
VLTHGSSHDRGIGRNTRCKPMFGTRSWGRDRSFMAQKPCTVTAPPAPSLHQCTQCTQCKTKSLHLVSAFHSISPSSLPISIASELLYPLPLPLLSSLCTRPHSFGSWLVRILHGNKKERQDTSTLVVRCVVALLCQLLLV